MTAKTLETTSTFVCCSWRFFSTFTTVSNLIFFSFKISFVGCWGRLRCLRWNLFESHNFGQQMLTFCWLNAHVCLKVTKKTLKIMGWPKWRGCLDFGFQTLIPKPDKVQSVLSTLPKPFFYMLSTWCLSFGWKWAKSRFLTFFLTILWLSYKVVCWITIFHLWVVFRTSLPTIWSQSFEK